MVNEEKVKLMTKIALFEKKEDNKDLVLGKYYREDYVKYNCLKTLVTSTICFWMFVGVYFMVKFQDILDKVNNMDYFKTISLLMAGYVAFAFVYEVIAFIVYTYKYSKAKEGLIEYNKNLKRFVNFDKKHKDFDEEIIQDEYIDDLTERRNN